MGNMATMLKRNPGVVRAPPPQGAPYTPYQGQPFVQQQPQYMPQPGQYGPPAFRPQQQQQVPSGYGPSFQNRPMVPHYSGPPPNSQNQSTYENTQLLSNLTGWSAHDIERLRHEYSSYANPYGVIDREGFRKLYIASLLDMTWEELEHDAEAAFHNFDVNRTGTLDFNEYITACTQMSREVNRPPPPPPPTYPPYNY